MMGDVMTHSEVRKNTTSACFVRCNTDHAENVPMHPDDFEAHHAWIMAKRFHELGLKERSGEKTVYYRIIG
jgi:hypothetical protein